MKGRRKGRRKQSVRELLGIQASGTTRVFEHIGASKFYEERGRGRGEAGTFGPASECRSLSEEERAAIKVTAPGPSAKSCPLPASYSGATRRSGLSPTKRKPKRKSVRKGRHVVVPGDGIPCPRCRSKTEIREHASIGDRELRRPFYYSRWFKCINPVCRTTLVMDPQFIVRNRDDELRKLIGSQMRDQLTPPPRLARLMPKRIPMTSNGNGARCAYCDRTLEATSSRSSVAATRDHWVPACQGGTSRLWCCWQCNNLKGDMTPREWLAFRLAYPEWWKRPEFKRGPLRHGNRPPSRYLITEG